MSGKSWQAFNDDDRANRCAMLVRARTEEVSGGHSKTVPGQEYHSGRISREAAEEEITCSLQYSPVGKGSLAPGTTANGVYK